MVSPSNRFILTETTPRNKKTPTHQPRKDKIPSFFMNG